MHTGVIALVPFAHRNGAFHVQRKIYAISLRNTAPLGLPGKAVTECKENDRIITS